MATASFENVYNEVSNSNIPLHDINGLDPMYHWDTHFPERMSRLHMVPEFSSPVARRSRKGRNRNSARFKTQPITFDEIKEVDEEAKEDTAELKKCKEGLKHQFTAFSRSMDGLMPTLHNSYSKSPDRGRVTKSDSSESGIECRTESESSSRLASDGATGDSASDDARMDMKPTITVHGVKLPEHLLVENANSRRQKRFKKKQRHNKSIEEVPETDKNGTEQAVR